MIYLDTSVALAQLLAEDRAPPSSLWSEPLIASRLLEYEIWTRLNAQRLDVSRSGAHSRCAASRFDRLSMLGRGQTVELASYDDRLLAAAQALKISIAAL